MNDPLIEAKYALDLLWRMRGGDTANDDELERAAHGVSVLIEHVEQEGVTVLDTGIVLGIGEEGE